MAWLASGNAFNAPARPANLHCTKLVAYSAVACVVPARFPRRSESLRGMNIGNRKGCWQLSPGRMLALKNPIF